MYLHSLHYEHAILFTVEHLAIHFKRPSSAFLNFIIYFMVSLKLNSLLQHSAESAALRLLTDGLSRVSPLHLAVSHALHIPLKIDSGHYRLAFSEATGGETACHRRFLLMREISPDSSPGRHFQLAESHTRSIHSIQSERISGDRDRIPAHPAQRCVLNVRDKMKKRTNIDRSAGTDSAFRTILHYDIS